MADATVTPIFAIPMDFAFVYQAGLLCPSHAVRVMARQYAAGKMPADPTDQTTYDSADWPKGVDRTELKADDYCDHCWSECLDSGAHPSRARLIW